MSALAEALIAAQAELPTALGKDAAYEAPEPVYAEEEGE